MTTEITQHAGGRPSLLNDEVLRIICDGLAEGTPLTVICSFPNMPAPRTVRGWALDFPEVAAAIARARDLGADAIAEEALAIADTPIAGERRKQSADGLEVTTEDMLGHRKLQVETRLKLLAKWNPKKYGDKMAVEHSGKISLEQLVAGDDE